MAKLLILLKIENFLVFLNIFLIITHKARSKVRFIVIDMYSPYISLILKMFPNASIIIDKFHLTQLISKAFNKTRIMVMKRNKKDYRKLKRYWKLLLKSRDELKASVWKKYTCFNDLTTEIDIVNYLINSDDELKDSYQAYQDLLYAFQHSDIKVLEASLNNNYEHLSSYMTTSINTLKRFLPYIKNTFNNNYHNGYIEGNNNFIKVIKRIAFGSRSFSRFKARIMICKGLILPKRKEA